MLSPAQQAAAHHRYEDKHALWAAYAHYCIFSVGAVYMFSSGAVYMFCQL